jgi:hypothetical protein
MGLPASAATGTQVGGTGGASVSTARLARSLPASEDVTAVTNFLFGYSIILDASTRVSCVAVCLASIGSDYQGAQTRAPPERSPLALATAAEDRLIAICDRWHVPLFMLVVGTDRSVAGRYASQPRYR